MYPTEITSTPFWIRHKLPLCASPPPDGDRELRNRIRSQHAESTDEIIEYYVRQERSRLDLKWCLDEFFYFNVTNPYSGQLVTANIFGRAHIAYIVEVHPMNILVTPVDMLGHTVTIGFDDIYTAEDSPFYEHFLHHQHLLHSQHVFDYIENQKFKDKVAESNHDNSYNMVVIENIAQDFDTEWPEGEVAWFSDDELEQYNTWKLSEQQTISTISSFSTVSEMLQELPTNSNLTMEEPLTQKKLLFNDELAKQRAISDFHFEYGYCYVNTYLLRPIIVTSTDQLPSEMKIIIASGLSLIMTFIFSIVLASFGSFVTFYCIKTTSSSINSMRDHRWTTFDWFRTLDVP